MQREAGLYGSIRVSLPAGVSEPFAYDDDRSIILMDWYHKSAYEQAAGLASIPFQYTCAPITGWPTISRDTWFAMILSARI